MRPGAAPAAVLLVAAAAVTTACGPQPIRPPEVRASAAAATSKPAVTAAAGTPAPTGSPGALGPAAGAHGLFIDLVATACSGTPAAGTAAPPDAERAGIAPGPDTGRKGIWAVTDAEGRVLLLDTKQRIVTGDQGEDGPLPAVYAEVCDKDVFVGDGTAADDDEVEDDTGAESATRTPEG